MYESMIREEVDVGQALECKRFTTRASNELRLSASVRVDGGSRRQSQTILGSGAFKL